MNRGHWMCFMMGKYGLTFPLCFMFPNSYSMVLLIEVKRSLFRLKAFLVDLIKIHQVIDRMIFLIISIQ